MLRTAVDNPTDDSEWQEFLRHRAFGQVVAIGAGRPRPIITPTHFLYDRSTGVEFHVHRANPLLQAIAEQPTVTITVLDADCFIPSTWNCEPGDDPLWSAPTSYYAVAHVTGEAAVMSEPQLADLLNRQVQRFQPAVEVSSVEVGRTPFGRALAAIVGIRVAVTAVEAKFKFGGNRTVGHRLSIARRLSERGGTGDLAALSHLFRRAQLEESAPADR